MTLVDGRCNLRKLDKGARLRYEGRVFFSVPFRDAGTVGVLAPLAGGVVFSAGSSMRVEAFGVVLPTVASPSGVDGDSGGGDSKLEIDITEGGGRWMFLN